MSVSLYKIKKWYHMLKGDSVHHVNQDEGKCYSKDEIKGYYNNLTEKVSRFGLPDATVPMSSVDSGERIYFAIEIFQYGLAAYDLYLMNYDTSMCEKTISCAEWAIRNQQEDGGWQTFAHKYKEHPYSAMAQGEGISLLIRANILTGNEAYLIGAKKAIEFMLRPIDNGGTTKYRGNEVFLLEYTHEPVVLNGWIFSLWGVLDYWKYTRDEGVFNIYQKIINTLEKHLGDYDNGYWTKYDTGGRVASPFYHRLHVAQLRVMSDLTDKPVFIEYANKWDGYQKSGINKNRAFIKKAFQKISEK